MGWGGGRGETRSIFAVVSVVNKDVLFRGFFIFGVHGVSGQWFLLRFLKGFCHETNDLPLFYRHIAVICFKN